MEAGDDSALASLGWPEAARLHVRRTTTKAAARQVVERHGGRLLELRAQRKRLVTFTLGGTRYTFDPNRIFTTGGIARTLRRYGPYSPDAHAAVGKLAAAILVRAAGGPDALLVAVHNNTAGNLSIASYGPGGPLQSEAVQVATSRARDPDDFFLVTEPLLFERLRALSFNVVGTGIKAARTVRSRLRGFSAVSSKRGPGARVFRRQSQCQNS